MVRVQVLMEREEREEFRRLAKRTGLSLSAWLRRAGLEQASLQKHKPNLDSKEALREFFSECDGRELRGEPDWQQHKKVIDESKRSGQSQT